LLLWPGCGCRHRLVAGAGTAASSLLSVYYPGNACAEGSPVPAGGLSDEEWGVSGRWGLAQGEICRSAKRGRCCRVVGRVPAPAFGPADGRGGPYTVPPEVVVVRPWY
ncbi:unnamed protein product, partial [Scytosiphon promiscuus]